MAICLWRITDWEARREVIARVRQIILRDMTPGARRNFPTTHVLDFELSPGLILRYSRAVADGYRAAAREYGLALHRVRRTPCHCV